MLSIDDRRNGHSVSGQISAALDAQVMLRKEAREIERVRAEFIDQVCDQYRQKGEIKLIKPPRCPDLHLFLREDDGRFHCVGYFDERRMGIVFVSR